MKKIYLSALFLGLIASANAQVKKEAMYKMGDLQNIDMSSPMTTTNTPVTKELGVEIWSDNFDSGANWTLSNSSTNNPGYTGSNYGWNIGSTVNSGGQPLVQALTLLLVVVLQKFITVIILHHL